MEEYIEQKYLDNLRPQMFIVANELKDIEFESVLELGCGFGENIMALEKTFSGKKIVGIDIMPTRVEIARKNTNAEIILGDINDLSQFEDKSFDIVFTNALFIMIEPKTVEKTIKEMVRIAKKKIILVECQSEDRFSEVYAGRLAANYKELFAELGLKATSKKIPKEVWGGEPWLSNGYIIKV